MTNTAGRALRLVAAALIVVAVTYATLLTAFTGFQSGDDDGYFLLSLRSVGAGHALYTKTYSQYGPAYFGIVGGLFRLFSLPFTLDNGRLVPALCAIVTAAIMAVAALRLTTSFLLSAVTFVVTAMLAPLEAAIHPSFVIALLVAVLTLTVATGPVRRYQAILAGAIVGTLLLVKVNVGLLVAAAFVAAWAGDRRVVGIRLRSAIVGGVPVGFLLLALRQQRSVTLVAGLAIAGLAVGAVSNRSTARDAVPVRAALVSAAAAGVVWCVYPLLSGTTAGDLVRGVVLDPIGQGNAFGFDFHVTLTRVPIALACLVAAAWLATERGRHLLRTRPLASGLVRAVAGLVLLVCGVLLHFPGSERLLPVDALVVGACLVWTLLLERRDHSGLDRGRFLICALATLMPLQAYPAAGGQRSVGGTLFGLVAVLLLADAITDFRCLSPSVGGAIERYLLAGVGAAIFASGVGWAQLSVREFHQATPIKLAGARHLRTTRPMVEDMRRATARLKTCDAFYGIPGMDSFYLFTGQQPPSWKTAGDWMTLFPAATQRAVVRDLAAHQSLCVVRNSDAERAWLAHGTRRPGPLQAFLTESSYDRTEYGLYEVYRVNP